MKFIRSFFLIFALTIFSSSVFADELNLLEDNTVESSLNQLVTYSGKDARKRRRLERDKYRGKGALYFSSIRNFQPSKSVFFQTNIGVGFLYFSGLRGNLMGAPTVNFSTATRWRDAPLKGRLSYNRTPLFEYLLGYRFNNWLKLALSYQHQGGVAIQTQLLSAYPATASPGSVNVKLSSNLSLDALLAKFYFELPFGIVCKSLSLNPYLAAGVGPGWQSWTQIQAYYGVSSSSFNRQVLLLRQKISANAVWMIDTGLCMQSTAPENSFSLLMGCKYNQWGQARSMGKMSQQGAQKLALAETVRVKTVYQFAPYLGVQWNFSPNGFSKNYHCLKKNSSQINVPYWLPSKEFQYPSSMWTQFNAGIGFLYFSGLRGNLMGRPSEDFDVANAWRDAPLKGGLSYNRTPLFEYLLGYRFNNWLKLALSYQHQGGVAIQTKALLAFPNASVSSSETIQFSSGLSLDALLAKVYFELPFALVWKNISTNPYLAAGIGPAWQSWAPVQVDFSINNTNFINRRLPLRQKISANVAWMIDSGLRLQSTYPDSFFSVLLGCKYNQWGQARSIGKMSQQGTYKVTITDPLRIKTVYQFAPYLGVQWNFVSNRYAEPGYKLKGRSPNVCLPYWVASKEFQSPKAIWTQFNVGVGFLYFSGLRGNLLGRPNVNFAFPSAWIKAPVTGRLSYNRTPLFEYLLGFKFNNWLKLALSYQHQSDITIQTKMLSAFPSNSTHKSTAVKFTSSLGLDAVLAKLYFELPFALIWKSLATNPYLAVGVGPGWQSWTQTNVNYAGHTSSVFFAAPLLLAQKVSANAVWMVDAGLRMQSAYPNSKFSVLLGYKYNQWGQARSIGKMSQQKSQKLSLTQPFRIKTVYQFAPYLGVQWNF